MSKFYTGIIKSYNQQNGYGFVECEETFATYNGDVFLHKNEFGQSGCTVGQEVKFQVMLSEKGQPRAMSICPADGSAPPLPTVPAGPPKGAGMKGGGKRSAAAQLAAAAAVHNPDQYFGQIRNFNQEKGFGFIECEQIVPQFGGSDVFLHYTEALNFRVGDYVFFDIMLGENNKPQAKNLQLSDGSIPGAEGLTYLAGPGQMGGGGHMDHGYGGYSRPPSHMGGKGYGKKGGGKSFHPSKEFEGLVKSYNAEKGYGFIECAETRMAYDRDVYLAKDQFDAHSLEVGEMVIFTVRLGAGGHPQSMIKGKAAALKQEGDDRLGQVGEGPHSGTIKSYNETKGFGFIECEATFAVFRQDVFLHKKEMTSVDDVGAEVSFNICLNSKGQPQATEMTVVGAPAKRLKAAVESDVPYEAF